jgi:hypothetical protein
VLKIWTDLNKKVFWCEIEKTEISIKQRQKNVEIWVVDIYLMSPEESTPLTPNEASACSPKGGTTYSHPGLAQKIGQWA